MYGELFGCVGQRARQVGTSGRRSVSAHGSMLQP